MTPTVALVVLAGFACASFFFALAETSLFSLGKWQLRQLETRSPQLGKIISRLLSEPQDLLATLVLGNSFANAGIVAVALWMALRHHGSLPLIMAALLVLILFGAEVAPKPSPSAPPNCGPCVSPGPCSSCKGPAALCAASPRA
jgi:Mg2+/Co2+ transporter CorB